MRNTAQIIRGLREDNDLKQADLAKVLSVSQQYYSKYETGQYELPIRHIITLAKFYNISSDYLLGLTDSSAAFINSAVKTPIQVLIDDILDLNDNSKKAVKDYVELLKLREKYTE